MENFGNGKKDLVKTRSAGKKKTGMRKRNPSYCSATVYTDSGELEAVNTTISLYIDCFSKNLVKKDEIECRVSNSGFF